MCCHVHVHVCARARGARLECDAVLYVYYMNHNEYTQQVQQGHPRRARHPLALEGHRNPDRSVTLAPLMELRSKRRLAHTTSKFIRSKTHVRPLCDTLVCEAKFVFNKFRLAN